MNSRVLRQLVVCACLAAAASAGAATAAGAPLEPTSLPAPLAPELEPNQSPAEAMPLAGDMRVRAALAAAGEADYYSFQAGAGDRVFAATMTASLLGAGADARTTLTLLQTDGATPIEVDANGGTLFRSASSIAGAAIPAEGTYFLRVEDARGAAATPAPYDLYLAIRSGAPAAEVEPNDEFTQATPLVDGEVTGTHEPGASAKDWFAVNLSAGDTVFLSLDLDPERSGGSFDGQLGFGLAGDLRPPLPQTILTVDDPQPGEEPDAAPSEALAMTVSSGGTYYGYVDVADTKVDTGGSFATYDLAVTVFPRGQPSCRTYSSFASALLDGGATTFPIQADDPGQIARAAVRLDLEATGMADLDVFLRGPTGLEIPLFADIGSDFADDPSERQQQLEAVFDDNAAIPPLFTSVRPLGLQPRNALAAFSGQQAEGAWSITVKDDTMNGSAGNLARADLVLCPQPGGGGGGSPGGGVATANAPGDATAQPQPGPAQPPALSRLRIAPVRFRAATAGPMVASKRPKSGGALVAYRSSEAAQVNFVIDELEQGRRKGRRCVRETVANAARKPCVRAVKVIGFRRDARAGGNRFALTGRVGARKLPPGEYRLKARAYAASGLASAPVGAEFTVLPPAPRKPAPGRGAR